MIKRKRAYEIIDLNGSGWFEVYADKDVLEMVRTLDWVDQFAAIPDTRNGHGHFSPLYDVDEAMAATIKALDEFTNKELEQDPDPDIWDF